MHRSTLPVLFALALGCADGSVQPEAEAPAADVAIEIPIEIPEKPAGGEVHGFPFQYQYAAIEDGILTLRQGEDFFPDLQVQIFLYAEKGEVPSERVYETGAPRRPIIRRRWARGRRECLAAVPVLDRPRAAS